MRMYIIWNGWGNIVLFVVYKLWTFITWILIDAIAITFVGYFGFWYFLFLPTLSALRVRLYSVIINLVLRQLAEAINGLYSRLKSSECMGIFINLCMKLIYVLNVCYGVIWSSVNGLSWFSVYFDWLFLFWFCNT